VSGFTREDALGFDDPKTVIKDFVSWIKGNTKGRVLFVSARGTAGRGGRRAETMTYDLAATHPGEI